MTLTSPLSIRGRLSEYVLIPQPGVRAHGELESARAITVASSSRAPPRAWIRRNRANGLVSRSKSSGGSCPPAGGLVGLDSWGLAHVPLLAAGARLSPALEITARGDVRTGFAKGDHPNVFVRIGGPGKVVPLDLPEGEGFPLPD